VDITEGVASTIPSEAGFRLELDGRVATITLDRPARLNSQTPETWVWLRRVGAELPGSIRVVVVRGAGRAFSAGLDRSVFTPGAALSGLAGGGHDGAVAAIAGFQAGFGWLARPDIVSIAAVQGHAIGAGFQLALACDLRILTEDAQLSMAEVTLGLVPDLGGTKRLIELVGYSRAAELCLTGRRVGAREALAMGLAAAVVPAAEGALDAALADTVAALLANPRDAVIETKALLLAAAGRNQADQEAAEREAQYRRLCDLLGIAGED
jgi:enoyl-CoA hydratase/carnithine racemase